MAGVTEHRRPYVGEGADGALRSAGIDRHELATLPTPGQPGYLTAIEERADAIRTSISRWEQQAADLTGTAGVNPVIHDPCRDTDDGTGPTEDNEKFEPGTAVDWNDKTGDRHSGIVETVLDGDRHEVMSCWDDDSYPPGVEAVEGARLTVSPWDHQEQADGARRRLSKTAEMLGRLNWERFVREGWRIVTKNGLIPPKDGSWPTTAHRAVIEALGALERDIIDATAALAVLDRDDVRFELAHRSDPRRMPAAPTVGGTAVRRDPVDLNATVPNRESGIPYLVRDGDLVVAASRYGRTIRECAEATWTAAVQVSKETGFRLSYEDLDHMMDLVVNDDPTVQGFLADAAVAARVRPMIDGGRPIRPLPDAGITGTGSPPSSPTWFERNHVEPGLVERAAQHVYASLDPKAALELAQRSGGDRQFAVWLHLTDEHRGYLPPSAPSLEGTDWQRLYQAGKSPYGAVIDAWERSEERPGHAVRPTAEDLDRLTSRGVEL